MPNYFYFFTDQPQNPWQMLTEPKGSAEPRLKITELMCSWTFSAAHEHAISPISHIWFSRVHSS